MHHGIGRTADLVLAKADEESALARGRALGLVENSSEQESCLIDDWNDGYPVSEEAAIVANTDRRFIIAWEDDVADS